MKTTLPKESDIERVWYAVDANNQPAGRLAVKIAGLLRGKGKRDFTPHIDQGDFVIVVNAAKIKLTGSKDEQKIYDDYSRYPGGLKLTSAEQMRRRKPAQILSRAVRDMLPKNHQSRTQLGRLKIYAGEAHPHKAQQPRTLELN